MAAMTEDQAGDLICFSRAIVFAVNDVERAMNKAYHSVPDYAPCCIGRGCMHWEWEENDVKWKLRGEVPDDMRRGDCALKRG